MLLFLRWIKSKKLSTVAIIPVVFLLIFVKPFILPTITPCLTNWNTTVSGVLHTNGFLPTYLKGVNSSLGTIDSDSKQILCRVPQGFILGPLLFFIYVNDLHKCSSVLDFHLFAHTKISLQDQNLYSVQLKLNEELDKVKQWLQLNL